jgi:hypothetical protein
VWASGGGLSPGQDAETARPAAAKIATPPQREREREGEMMKS